MAIFNQIIDFFRSHHNDNNKKTSETSRKSTIVEIKKKKVEPSHETSPTASTTPIKTPSSSHFSQIPEVEFEQSRHLLELDFFHMDDDRHQSGLITTFPQFDYLLNPPVVQPEEKKKATLNRKLTQTLKHRISIYRPNNTKTVKRSLSSPQLYNNN